MNKPKPNVMKISVKTHSPKRDALRAVDELPDLYRLICIHKIRCPEYVGQALFP